MLSPGKKLFYSTFFLVSFIFLFLYIYILTSNTIPGVAIIHVQVKVTFESVKKHNVLHGWLQTVIIRNTGVLLYKDINFWSSLYLRTQPCIHRRAVNYAHLASSLLFLCLHIINAINYIFLCMLCSPILLLAYFYIHSTPISRHAVQHLDLLYARFKHNGC